MSVNGAMTFRGPYGEARYYTIGDVVTHNGIGYICTVDQFSKSQDGFSLSDPDSGFIALFSIPTGSKDTA